MKKITKINAFLLALLFPPRCPVCDRLLEFHERIIPGEKAGEGIHKSCMQKLILLSEPVCMKCGQPINHERMEYCGDCIKGQHKFVQGKSVFLYKTDIKGTMYRFKYGNKREYADFFAKIAAEKYAKWISDQKIDILIPVPMYRKKEKMRGYNQATVFAKALSKEIGILCRTDLVYRIKNTLPQKNLSDAERKSNLKNAFSVLEEVKKYKKILLIDDIYTTGSTVDEIAASLHKTGVFDIFFLSICIGKGA